jgi:hypothetical protein
MKDNLSIEKIIDSFRKIFDFILDFPEKDKYVKRFFKTGDGKVIQKRINNYFDEEIRKAPYEANDLNIMRDGVLYLIEKITDIPHEVKVLLYLSLFHEDQIFTEEEIQNLVRNHDFFN